MKKLSYVLLSLCLLVQFFIVPEVEAKTLRDLQNELEETIKEYEENEGKTELTQEQIDTIKGNISSIRLSIVEMNDQMVELQNEIADLEEDIKDKDKQIKEIMNFVQISNGESAYLEYAFGAQDFTDFIYRVAVAEQLADYNSQLIDDFNRMIEENKQKKVELDKKTEELKKKQESYASELEKLNRDMLELEEARVNIEDEIKAQKETIAMYEKKGCKLDDDIEVCGRDVLPATTAFYRPIISGYVTSEYGYRCIDWGGGDIRCNGHSGIDMSTSANNEPIYASGTGLVAKIFYRTDCGGNMVFVHHRLSNGETYTSAYYHLRSISVSVGDLVTKDTVIGIMGGDPSVDWWDECSTGTHIHMTLAYGLYGVDYASWDTFVSKTFNPRLFVNAPTTHYSWFNDRYTRYD